MLPKYPGIRAKHCKANQLEILDPIHRVLNKNTHDCCAFEAQIDAWLTHDHGELHAKYCLTPIKIAAMLRFVKDDLAPQGWNVSYAMQQWTIEQIENKSRLSRLRFRNNHTIFGLCRVAFSNKHEHDRYQKER